MKKKSQIVIVVAILFFLSFAAVFAFTFREVSQKGVHYAEAERTIAEHVAKESSFNRVENLLEATKTERAKIKSYFLSEKETIAFISEVEANAKEIGVVLTTNELAIKPAESKEGVPTTPAILSVGLDFSGNEESVLNFITLLESMPYHKSIPDLAFIKTDTNQWKANITMHLTLGYD